MFQKIKTFSDSEYLHQTKPIKRVLKVHNSMFNHALSPACAIMIDRRKEEKRREKQTIARKGRS